MSGRAYTMKEMRGIVDYIKERKAYSETKARKMWMDFASSDLTTRTWQSLKETFLKRILPDIHNPYYRLTPLEIRSFRAGREIKSTTNKLEFRSSSEEPDPSDVVQVVLEEAPQNGVDNSKGEESSRSKNSDRSSVDTVILATEQENVASPQKTKSLRDCIAYTEPLTPMMQEILHDFESSDEEQPLVIVEEAEVEKEADDLLKTLEKPTEPDTYDSHPQGALKSSIKEALRRKSLEKEKPVESASQNETKNKKSEVLEASTSSIITPNKTQSTPTTTTNSMTDSLPNNQEALNDSNKTAKSKLKSPKAKRRKKADSEITPDSVQAVTSSNDKIAEEKRQEEEIASSIPLTNPCLESVSLYAVQIDNSDDEPLQSKTASEKENRQPKETKDNQNKANEDRPLNKDKTEGSNDIVILKSESESDNKKSEKEVAKQKTQVTRKRDKLINNLFDSAARTRKDKRRNGGYSQNLYLDSDSSDWTSQSDDDQYVSPPRHRNRHSRKYLKPSSGRILALEQEGGLFVACGKKVYPLVKDGRLIKNYLTYDPESDSEEQEQSYWQMKYLEERKKTAELKKLLENNKEEEYKPKKRRSTLLQHMSPILQKKPSRIDHSLPIEELTSSNENLHGSELVLPEQVEKKPEDKTVKIKFAKDNEEVFLEGNWQNIHHILGDVMQMFNKGGKAADEPREPKERAEPKERCPDAIEEADDETHKRVDKLEEEIFKEVEEIDKSTEEATVSERKKRSRLSLSKKQSPPPPRPKRQRINEEKDRSDTEIIVNEKKLRPVEEPVKKRSPRKSETKESSPAVLAPEDETLYKFPSPEPQRRGRPSRGKLAQLPKSPDSNGYQDSDGSPSYHLRRRRKSATKHIRKKYAPKSYEMNASDESSNSLPTNKTRVTESYQLLMNAQLPKVTLEKIDESPCPNEIDFLSMNSLHLSPASQNLESKTDNSSNVSLPLSPELSLVENISVSKEVLNSVVEQTIETQMHIGKDYRLTGVDASVPLMEQDLSVKSLEPMDVSEEKASIQNNPTITESIDEKMREMLIESAKKPKKNNKEKGKSSRCSTPQKRKRKAKSQTPSVDVIDEQMEQCANGRKSCPPVLNTIDKPKKPKRQKEIIKVKITRPKKKKNVSLTQTDSGVNDSTTSAILKDLNATVDLIHNHTESCLANCFDESVQLMENVHSVISVDSTNHGESGCNVDSESGLPPDMFNSDAQDATDSILKGFKLTPPTNSIDNDYHTPPASFASVNSLLTEDMSDEIASSLRPDFYYSSDDEPPSCTISGSNLKNLFPVTVTVPDLSTITEMSQDTNTRNLNTLDGLPAEILFGSEEFVTCSR